jgi:chorismate synthase
VELGGVRAPAGIVPGPGRRRPLDADEVRCLDPEASAAMVAAIDQAHKDGDTLGGVVGWWPTVCHRASDRTCTGTVASTRGWPGP